MIKNNLIKMKFFCRALYLFMCLSCSITLSQQVLIDDKFTPQQLIENNLIQGCVETSNITSQVNGSVNGFKSFAYFEKGSSNFPFENGIMLSTGKAVSGGNGQNTAVLNEGQNNWQTDPDLETALGISNTLNATSIEFDFISISNQIQFDYILASEEYFQNFPCNYSDGFAFLIKEAGTTQAYTNIALIPGTSIPVNTNTIHPAIVGFCPASNAQYFQGYNLGDTNYNGQTVVMSASAAITPNITYHIKLIIADQTDKNYDSAVFIRGNSFNATVDLGENITTCAESVTLNGNIDNPQAAYSWFLNSVPINGEVQPTLNVTQSGSYTVQIEMPLAGSTCVIEDTVQVTLSSTQTVNPIPDYELCDDESMDGVETFDLSTQNNAVLASLPASNYSISYHFSSTNAQDNMNPIIGPIQNSTNNQIIYVRIEDIINGCLAFSNFNLVVNPLPDITSISTFIACDDAVADGITQIDFTQSDDEIINGQSNLSVTYHQTQAEATAGVNAIQMPYTNTNRNGQVFVRVENNLTGCFRTTTLQFSVIDSPEINYEDVFIDACDKDYDGFATFDLNTVTAEILQGLTGVTVTFHETSADAESGTDPIANPASYNNTLINEQTLFIRVEDNSTGCASVRSFEIHSNLLLTGTNIHDFSTCENDSNEGFNLNKIAEDIINNLPDVTVIFYQSESNRDNQINALDPNKAFVITESPTMLYITINSLTCSEEAELELLIQPVVEFPEVDTVSYCDYDNDGFASIDLHSFDSLITGGQTGFIVTYYASESDAEDGINRLPDFYTNTTNPITIYTKISSTGSGCGGGINPLTINVLAAPITTKPNDIIVCDNDQDGFAIIDLTQVYGQLVTSTTDRAISFYDSNEDLINETNAFTNITNYNTDTKAVFVKATNTMTGCWSSENFTIYVNTLPNFPSISKYIICENSSDGIGDFKFSTKDSEILNGQTGKKTRYYLNQTDADNDTNRINKTTAYGNVTNPQRIFVRVENTTDPNCYGTSSFEIEVGTNPQYNQPMNVFKCDDISNDASEEFDLTAKVAEITQGVGDNLEVTFYTTLNNAQKETNPIAMQFKNTVNPQQIYVRIDNGTICASITSFTLNVVQIAQANPAQPLEVCDTNNDGIVTFDLTLSEIDILDVRQDNIEISYYKTLADLDTRNNPINNPTTFNNQTNPQTVYVRLNNTISDCYLAIPLKLIVNVPPAINQFGSIVICNNETNFFNLLEVNNRIVNDTTNTIITYHSSAIDAMTDSNPLNTDYTYTSNSTRIHARVENATTGCFNTYAFMLEVKPLPIANTPNNLIDCDDDYDGLLEFDLSAQNAVILGTQNPASFSVTYYNSLFNAQSGSNVIPDLYVAFHTEIIYARVENNSTGCYRTTQFSSIINPKPFVDIPDQVICLDNSPLLVSANTNNPTDTYLWSTNETTPEINISTIGTYSVTVTNEFNCTTTQVFNLIESEQANIDIVETVDFSDPNNITITISGIGNYLYQLDDHPPQESNIFENAGIGYHTITVIDLNGCSEATKEVLVLDFPKFVTPNQDGYFDTWHITGVETLPGTVIYIYDRYGKQLSFLTATSKGWDGTYNGQNMPATDYWFVAHVKGGSRYDFEAKGHFALKR